MPTVSWFNGSEPLQTAGGMTMGKHVVVNRLEIPHLTRDAYNSTLRCQASNTKLAPPVERIVRLDMLRKYSIYMAHYSFKWQHYLVFSSLKIKLKNNSSRDTPQIIFHVVSETKKWRQEYFVQLNFV